MTTEIQTTLQDFQPEESVDVTFDEDDDSVSSKSSIRSRAGKPIPIIIPKDDHSFELDEVALRRILLDSSIRDKHIVLVSVAGAFRKGKSFLLDFFLRYLHAGGSENWIGDDDTPLDGFSWKGGSERDTSGILLWSEPFLRTLPNGEQVAILLMDTQGSFDSESTVKDCATIFALSTMVSSVQIFNIFHNIQEDDLQHLQLFTEYGRLALEDDAAIKPFQKLLFLVRDWSFPYEAQYGADGGRVILGRRLTISDKQHPELQSLRKHINSCFDEITCFLMPHPGLKVATNPEFNGRLSDIELDFKKNLRTLVPLILAPENLIAKEIAGQKIKSKDLLQYFKSYIQIYQGDELPEPKSMLVATAEGNNLAAVGNAKDLYKTQMDEVCGGTKPYLSTAHLESEHTRIKEKAIQQFVNKRKMGGEEFSEKYKQELIKDLDEMFVQFRAQNEGKNVFKAARTPAVLFAAATVAYILSGIFGIVGIYSLANLCNLIMGTFLLALGTWAYVRYSGEMRELGAQIDEGAEWLWENVMKPTYQYFVEPRLQEAAIHAVATVAANSTAAVANSTAAVVIESNGKAKQS